MFLGWFASHQQDKFQRIQKDADPNAKIDWRMLAYSVGFGGSMIWFGSSAGVAITNKFPESRNVVEWVKKGWQVAVAYVIGFFALYLIMGWEPTDNKEHKMINCLVPCCPLASKNETIKASGSIGYNDINR